MRLNSVTHSLDVSLSQRTLLIAVVVLLHVAVLGMWATQPHIASEPHEMLISMAMAQPEQLMPSPPEPVPATTVQAQAKPQRVEQAVAPTQAEATPQVAAPSVAAVLPATPSASTLPDREPDFSAAYLNNPKPIYPLAARRMGWQGKVIVRVEVLASGAAGEVSLYQSSGREALDNAALTAIKSWRFSPARVAGQLITKTFLVPIPFKLETDSE